MYPRKTIKEKSGSFKSHIQSTACCVGLLLSLVIHAEVDPTEIIAKAYEQTRGLSSYTELSMIVKRANWTKTSEFSVWTRGDQDALIRFTAPAKDAGNATLRLDNRMWSYSPVIKRAIRLPKSAMSQEWAGSDFSYRDLARAEDILDNYTIELVKVEEQEGHEVYTIDAIPLEDAPIVWGKERIVIRDDFVLVEHVFYDQELVVVKSLKAMEIGELGGRTIPIRMRMSDAENPERWTEVIYNTADFEASIDDRLFTQFALRGEL